MHYLDQTVMSAGSGSGSAASVASALARPATGGVSAPRSSGSTTASSTTGTTSTVTADDFLTLLVAEMKNQDPTQPTDPNAYISQMVNVNSLQQLIGINQGVASLDAAAGSTNSGSSQ